MVSKVGELLHRPARGRGRDPGLRARSAPARRRPSGSAGCCGPRPTGGRRTSTRSSPATPSTPTSPPTGSGSWPSRATPTRSSTPTTCWPRSHPAPAQVPHISEHTHIPSRGTAPFPPPLITLHTETFTFTECVTAQPVPPSLTKRDSSRPHSIKPNTHLPIVRVRTHKSTSHLGDAWSHASRARHVHDTVHGHGAKYGHWHDARHEHRTAT